MNAGRRKRSLVRSGLAVNSSIRSPTAGSPSSKAKVPAMATSSGRGGATVFGGLDVVVVAAVSGVVGVGVGLVVVGLVVVGCESCSVVVEVDSDDVPVVDEPVVEVPEAAVLVVVDWPVVVSVVVVASEVPVDPVVEPAVVELVVVGSWAPAASTGTRNSKVIALRIAAALFHRTSRSTGVGRLMGPKADPREIVEQGADDGG